MKMLKTAGKCLAGIKELLKKSGLFPSFSARKRLAFRHLRGTGLEIGALHFPLRVPSNVAMKYVDFASRVENIKAHTDVPGEQIVEKVNWFGALTIWLQNPQKCIVTPSPRNRMRYFCDILSRTSTGISGYWEFKNPGAAVSSLPSCKN